MEIARSVKAMHSVHNPPMRMTCRVDDLNDPRIAAYRNLKDRDLAAMPGELFIAEGEQVVRRLIASSFAVDSVLLNDRRVEEIAPIIPEHVPVYSGSSEVVNAIIGFKFHSGVMAVGRRGRSATIDEVIAGKDRLLLMVCPELANTENLGALIRIAAALGVDAMVLGERSCDPFFRQSVRVSMGAVFSVPIVRSDHLLRDLRRLTQNKVELFATVLDESAEPLSQVEHSHRAAILFGNEARGLSDDVVALCDRRVTR